jgi:hypothetical protein
MVDLYHDRVTDDGLLAVPSSAKSSHDSVDSPVSAEPKLQERTPLQRHQHALQTLKFKKAVATTTQSDFNLVFGTTD